MYISFSLSDYPRLAGEYSDSRRIKRAAADCRDNVLYIPKGIYISKLEAVNVIINGFNEKL